VDSPASLLNPLNSYNYSAILHDAFKGLRGQFKGQTNPKSALSGGELPFLPMWDELRSFLLQHIHIHLLIQDSSLPALPFPMS
jgi:hypothetical protein